MHRNEINKITQKSWTSSRFSYLLLMGGCNRFPIFRYWPFFIPIIRYFPFFIPIIRYSHTFRYPIFRKFDDNNDFYYRYSDICDFFLPIIRYLEKKFPIIRYSHTFRYPIFRKFDDDNPILMIFITDNPIFAYFPLPDI